MLRGNPARSNRDTLLSRASWLAVFTILYNIAEGIVSVYFGYNDDTLALSGFGLDSFVEVISGAGILHMILRIRSSKVEEHDRFEKIALRITGYAFFLLAAGLAIGVVINVVNDVGPSTTIPGIIISAVSIATMYFLMLLKLKTGEKLGSDAIIADAHCTRSCLLLSLVLLAASIGYEIFRINYIDLAGSLAIAWLAYKEGREALEKADRKNPAVCCDHCKIK